MCPVSYNNILHTSTYMTGCHEVWVGVPDVGVLTAIVYGCSVGISGH